MKKEDLGCQSPKCKGCEKTSEEDVAVFFTLLQFRMSATYHVMQLVYKRDYTTYHDWKWRLTCKLSPSDDMRFFESSEEAILKYSVAGIKLYKFPGSWEDSFYTLDEVEKSFTRIA